MLFNSYSFIFVFLPVVVLGFVAVNSFHLRSLSLGWLVLCSMGFYGIWNPYNLVVILPSIAVNYGLGCAIRRKMAQGENGEKIASRIVAIGVVMNLCFLGYFKYKNFFLGSLNDVFGMQLPLAAVILPLGISFITFQKIAFLVDIRSGVIQKFDLYDFLTFVFFFPQLIAGPIVHYREMMPQFEKITGRLDSHNLAVGVCLFSMGLFKKVVLADGIAPYVAPVFNAAGPTDGINLFSAWMGATAYTLQIYFDFSGYSDMALGLARIFGIRLPFNFNSPLKSSSIIEFWSRWHVTLTRFLTAYVYTPVVMNLMRSRMVQGKPVLTRKRPTLGAFLVLTAWPTILTMLLSGLWHGAGATFILWGALHGIYLVVNHAWRQWRPVWNKARYEQLMKPFGFVLTLSSVIVAMVLFRANTVASAGHILVGMTGYHGATIPQSILNRLGGAAHWVESIGIHGDMSSASVFMFSVIWIIALLFISIVMPNSLEILRHVEPALYFGPAAGTAKPATLPAGAVAVPRAPLLKVEWTTGWAFVMGALFLGGVLGLNRVSEFLYWQF